MRIGDILKSSQMLKTLTETVILPSENISTDDIFLNFKNLKARAEKALDLTIEENTYDLLSLDFGALSEEQKDELGQKYREVHNNEVDGEAIVGLVDQKLTKLGEDYEQLSTGEVQVDLILMDEIVEQVESTAHILTKWIEPVFLACEGISPQDIFKSE